MIEWMSTKEVGGGGVVGGFKQWIESIKKAQTHPLKENSEKCIVKQPRGHAQRPSLMWPHRMNWARLTPGGGGRSQGVSVKKQAAALKSISHCRSSERHEGTRSNLLVWTQKKFAGLKKKQPHFFFFLYFFFFLNFSLFGRGKRRQSQTFCPHPSRNRAARRTCRRRSRSTSRTRGP